MSIFSKFRAAAPEAPAADQIFLARQPILDADLNVHAYELLYRGGNTGKAEFKDANFATTKLITNTFLEFGIDHISGGKPVFINLPRSFVTGEIPIPLPAASVVLEVLEDISADEAALAGLKRLKQEGFTIALDDFVTTAENAAFIPLARYIKVDILALDDAALRREVEALLRTGVELLAEKVETEAQFQLCKSLGFRYFQGYFFSRPKLIEGRQLPANQVSLLNMLAKLQDPDCQIEDIEAIVTNDVGMSYKLFKSINSSYYGVGKTVESIQHALILLGLNTLKKWITLITLTSSEEKPRELIILALIRARMCEQLATQRKVRADAAFTVGLFSLLDALMDQPLESLLGSLPLAPDIVTALLERKGPLGELLSSVIHYEKADWEALAARGVRNADMFKAYQEALQWSDGLMG